jgi:hypothetical protein
VGVLGVPAALPRIASFAVRRTRQRLFVGNLWTTDARLNAELACETAEDDLKVQLAHAGDDDLPRRRVGLRAHRRIFGHERSDTVGEPGLISLGLGLEGDRQKRVFGHFHRVVHSLCLKKPSDPAVGFLE